MFVQLSLVFLWICMISVVEADQPGTDCSIQSHCPYFSGYVEFQRPSGWWCSKTFAHTSGSEPLTLQMAQEICEHNYVTLSTLETTEEWDYHHTIAEQLGVTGTWLAVKQNETTGHFEWDNFGQFDATINPQPTNMGPGKWPAWIWGSEGDLGHFQGVNMDGTDSPVNMLLCGYPGF